MLNATDSPAVDDSFFTPEHPTWGMLSPEHLSNCAGPIKYMQDENSIYVYACSHTVHTLILIVHTIMPCHFHLQYAYK